MLQIKKLKLYIFYIEENLSKASVILALQRGVKVHVKLG